VKYLSMRAVYVVAGHAFVALAVIGVFLPIMPTTPFLLVAVWCYSRGSERFHRWLVNHPRFGRQIVDWMDYGVIRPRVKVVSIVLVCSSLIIPIFFMSFHWGLKLCAVLVVLAVSLFIATRASHRPSLPPSYAPLDRAKTSDE
jgi:uncharacterized membrane protein YbaN (DUF454 family)